MLAALNPAPSCAYKTVTRRYLASARAQALLFWQHSLGAGSPEVWVVPVQLQSNVLSRYTNMRVIIPHAGAYIPYQAVRI